MWKFIFGENSALVHQYVHQEEQQFTKQSPASPVLRFDAEDGQGAWRDFITELDLGFFDTAKLIILQNPSSLGDTFWQEQKVWLTEAPKNDAVTVLFVESAKPEKKAAWYKLLVAATNEQQEFTKKTQKPEELLEAVWQQFSGQKLSAGMVRTLAERTGGDGYALVTAAQKVMTYTGGKDPDAKELDMLVPKTLETKVFDALDRVLNGQKEAALVFFTRLQQDEDAFRLLGMCAWQIRQMLLVEAATKQGLLAPAIASSTKIHPFAVQKIQRSLAQFPRQRLVAGLSLLREIDFGLKRGTTQQSRALEHFVYHF
jgi:DNA polymerase III delta subunit